MMRPNVSRAAGKVVKAHPERRDAIIAAAASKNEAEFALWCIQRGFEVPWATLKGEPDARPNQ